MPGRDFVALRDVHFAHDSAAAPMLSGLNLQLPTGWTGIVGPNGGGKTTLLRLVCGELTPQQGAVRLPGLAFLCPQRTDDRPPDLDAFLSAHGGHANTLRAALAIGDDWPERWASLSCHFPRP